MENFTEKENLSEINCKILQKETFLINNFS